MSRALSSPSEKNPSDLGSPRVVPNGRGSESREWSNPPVGPVEDILPPQELIEEACDIFFVRINQCAFLHKPTFIARLRDPARVVSSVLIYAICASTYRFSPGLVQFCGSCKRPPSYFGDRARALLFEALGEPTLEACQAAYLLGIADWGACKGKRSWMIMGIAARMAFLLGLHKEETHAVPPGSPRDQIIAAEEARRTFWTLYINDRSSSSGGCRPSAILASEVSARLPCDEDSFAFGTPTPPYYLAEFHRPPLQPNGSPVDMGMMAYMVQVAELWGRAARRACNTDRLQGEKVPPWDMQSEYSILKSDLNYWRSQLPNRQQYSRGNLSVYYQRGLETAFTWNHVVHKAAEVILRRAYLPYIIRALAPETSGLSLDSLEAPWQGDVTPAPHFWVQCGKEMFYAAIDLITIIMDFTTLTHYSGLSPHLGFSTFLGAATLMYAWRWPWLFPERSMEVPQLVLASTDILATMTPTWPMARHWVKLLRQPIKKRIDEAVQDDIATDQREGIYRQASSLDDDGSGNNSGDEMLSGVSLAGNGTNTPRSPNDHSPVAPALHTLAMAAAGSVVEAPSPMQSQPPMPMMHPGQVHPPMAHMLPQAPPQHQQGQDFTSYSLLGPHSEMPFGDPSGHQSFNDVLAFMEGAEQWAYPPPPPT
ncbi:hypothetical protein GLOTRDRAFT_140076 [Gloeophyllum trabeum ATCC 11539]|uniref:Xylanolytic transcriptional activator regulatory domain-containing protein n=1 Tax=Gloeophyllum trabeum (strain ATCC 11539 / FP-39264 / Madison 617) TaxID=670483 RepID=S7RG21_GLOTA|nr:uncharacterized protein GLOTRDRAFT_140076 [Gloeophyllum trabeum ATCC 11539]EPQ53165.1 hypothetical protein GLOTRDRAFT_140076 [Gloeophyllum trabeum ATCC 11539]